jgi:hypothetical protein
VNGFGNWIELELLSFSIISPFFQYNIVSTYTFRISYLHLKDARETYTKKGAMSRRGFGFYANEPFYLRSRLPMQRVAECVGANNIVLKKWANNRKAQ